MIKTIHVTVNGTITEKKINSKHLPNILNGEYSPAPFLMNLHKTTSSVIQELIPSDVYQWSKVYGQHDIRVLFAAPEHWTTEGILNNFTKYGINTFAIYITKFHEIMGNALFFRVHDGKPVDLTTEEFTKIEKSANLAIGSSDEDRQFSIMDDQSSKEERIAIWEKFLDKMLRKTPVITYEFAYLYIYPAVNNQYIIRNVAYYNSYPTYCLSSDRRGAYIIVKFEKGSAVPEDVNYINYGATQYEPYRPVDYDDIVDQMTRSAAKLSIKYVPSQEPDQVIKERAEKAITLRKGRTEYLEKLAKKKGK